MFMLPACIILTMLVSAPKGKRLRMVGGSILLLGVAGMLFVPIYDYLGKQNVSTKDASSITDMFTKKDYFDKYLNQETKPGDTKEVGRVDAFTVPLAVIKDNPVWFAFGVGLGNAAVSNLGTQYSGAHSPLLGKYASGGSSAGAIVLEIGVFGLLCVFGLHWLIYKDSMHLVRTSDDLLGTIAIAWPAVVLLVSVSFFYFTPITTESIPYLFWYFSGLLAAHRTRKDRAARDAAQRARRRSNRSTCSHASADTSDLSCKALINSLR